MTIHFQMLLLQDLKRFGLNPADWVIKNILSTVEFQVQHRSDPDFILQGKSCWNEFRPRWEMLELAGF